MNYRRQQPADRMRRQLGLDPPPYHEHWGNLPGSADWVRVFHAHDGGDVRHDHDVSISPADGQQLTLEA